jgi:hypothetical protein
MNGGKIQLDSMDRPSKSLEVICKHVKAGAERELVEVDDRFRVKFNPDAEIKTEMGKAWFYDVVYREGIREEQSGLRMLLIELANYKYSMKENK